MCKTLDKQTCFCILGRCARGPNIKGEVHLFPTPASMGNKIVKPCMKEYIKQCKAGDCMRLAALELMYLKCMPHSQIDTLKSLQACSGHCSTTCSCALCNCCINCANKCPCDYRRKGLDLRLL